MAWAWLTGLMGGGAKEAGEGIKAAAEGFSTLANGIRSAITGELSADKKAELLKIAVEAEAAAGRAQTDINKVEAASTSLFVAGWRPGLGWICDISIACYYIPQSLMSAFVWTWACIQVMKATPDMTKLVLPPFPQPYNWAELMGLVLALLGIGVQRVVEKVKGVQDKH